MALPADRSAMRLYFVLALACTALYSMTVWMQAVDDIQSHLVFYSQPPERSPLVWTPPPAEPAMVHLALGM
jgi:hypothetical protein